MQGRLFIDHCPRNAGLKKGLKRSLIQRPVNAKIPHCNPGAVYIARPTSFLPNRRTGTLDSYKYSQQSGSQIDERVGSGGGRSAGALGSDAS